MKGPIRPMYKTASYHKLYRANPQKTKPKIRNATMTSLAGTALEMLNPSIVSRRLLARSNISLSIFFMLSNSQQ